MQHIRRLMLITAVLSVLAGSLFFTSGSAHAQTRAAHTANWTVCQTLNLSGDWWNVGVWPRMTVPVCYNGSRIWQNGSVTAGVLTLGFLLDGMSWSGTYNSGGGWIGAGENYTVTPYGGWATIPCATRWMIDAWGNVFYYARNC